MSTDKPTIADGLRAILAEEGAARATHPSRDELHAYTRDLLSAEVDDTIRDHLIHCSDCAAEILEFDRFEKLPTAVPSQQPHFGGTASTERQREDRAFAPYWRPWSQPRVAWTLAAACLLLSIVLPLRQAHRRDLPSLNEAPFALDPLSRSGLPQEIVVPASSERFLILWTPRELPTAAQYRLEIHSLDENGPRPWSEDGLYPRPEGTFSFSLSKRFLPAGFYRLKLWPAVEPSAVPFAEREVRLVYQ